MNDTMTASRTMPWSIPSRLTVLGDILPYSAPTERLADAVAMIQEIAPNLYRVDLGAEFGRAFRRVTDEAGVPADTIDRALSSDATDNDRRNLRVLAVRAWAKVVKFVNNNRYAMLLHGAEGLSAYGLDVPECVAEFHGLPLRKEERAGESCVLVLDSEHDAGMIRATSRKPSAVS